MSLRSTLLLLTSISPLALAADVHVRVSPEVKTGIEATTEFPTIQMALDHHPFATPNADGTPGRVYLEIAPGTYRERIIVTQNHDNITLLGMGTKPEDVVITNALNAKTAGGTFFTETVEINGTGFEADNVTFENAAGNTGQAVAVANRGDRSVFKHCRFVGDQDTLFADFGRQYYVDSYITGGVDFIFGNATAVFDRSEIHAIRPAYLTAQSRTTPGHASGYVIVRSRVTADFAADSVRDAGSKPQRHTVFLGRPWRPYARVIVMQTELPAAIDAAGWDNWNNASNEATAYFGETGNTGPGSNTSGRVPWAHALTAAQARTYMPRFFLQGKDHWNPEAEAAKLP